MKLLTAVLLVGLALWAVPGWAQAPAVPPTAQEARNLVDVGNKRLRAHNVAGAMEAYTKAIALDPQLSLAYYARAKARTGQNDLAGALADYTKVIEIEPTAINPYYFRGLLYVQQEMCTEARSDFIQVRILNPFINLPCICGLPCPPP